MASVDYLSAPFRVETEMAFPVTDDRTLIFRPGAVQCRVSMLLEPQPYHNDGDQDITVRLLVVSEDSVSEVWPDPPVFTPIDERAEAQALVSCRQRAAI